MPKDEAPVSPLPVLLSSTPLPPLPPSLPPSFRGDLRGAAAGQGRLEGEGRGKDHSRPEHAEAEGGGEARHLSMKKEEGL